MTDKKDQDKPHLRVIRKGDKSGKAKGNTTGKGGMSIPQYKLDEVDYQILQILLKMPGATQDKIGAELGYSRSVIGKRTRRPAFKAAIIEHTKKAVDHCEEVQAAAMRRLKALISNHDPEVALKAVKLALQPFFNTVNINSSNIDEIIYRVQFGDGGTLFQTKEELKASGSQESDIPKSALDLLQ